MGLGLGVEMEREIQTEIEKRTGDLYVNHLERDLEAS